jgi:hypothetical protein
MYQYSIKIYIFYTYSSFPKLCSYHTKHSTTLEIPDAKTAATFERTQYPLSVLEHGRVAPRTNKETDSHP